MEAQVAVACGCALGESALWDHRSDVLYWVDILAPAVWRLHASGAAERLDVGERIGFVALTTSPTILLAGFKSGLALLDVQSGAVSPLVSPEPGRPGNRINDGTVAPNGTVYFGTMDDNEREATGAFWRFDARALARFGPDVVVSNGPAVNREASTIYYVDSVGRLIFAASLRPTPADQRLFAKFPEEWGHPDGVAVDIEGGVWVCHWGGGRVTRFTPEGKPERVLRVPATNVTKCAFGGADLDTLFITTARRGCDPLAEPNAGHVFTANPGVRGAPAGIAPIAWPGRSHNARA